MDIKSVLEELGLSSGEIEVYLALLKLGSNPVSRVKEETGLHRTTIYDFIEKLLNKGLVSYVIRNNIKYYNAAHPNKLVEFLNEKQKRLAEVLPRLNELADFHQEEVKVEVYKGKEGLKTVMLECIRTGEDTIGIGVDDELYKKALPVFIEQYQKMLEENNIHERVLTKLNYGYLFDSSNTEYRFLPNEHFSPTSTMVYGDKVQIVLWEPSLTTLLIQNRKLAEDFKKHFEILWRQESMIFHGEDEIRAIFDEMVQTLQKGQQYIAFGIPPLSEKWDNYFDEQFCQKLDRKGVKMSVILDERAEQLMRLQKYPTVSIRSMSKEYMSPAEVDVWGDKAAIILWGKKPMAIVINNKQIAQSFTRYFELLWGIAKKVD